MSDPKLTVLPNGLRVLTDYMDSVQTATVGVWVKMGARYEDAGLNGISHMLEHMAFKGTKSRSALDIVEEIENVGGYMNAYTSREMTAYYVRVLADDVGLAVDVLSDILGNPAFPEDELKREKGVIAQEIKQALDTPDDVVYDHYQKVAFPGQPLGRPVLGTMETIANMNRQTLYDFMAAGYAPERLVVAAAGNVDHNAFVKLAEKTFGKATAGKVITPKKGVYTGGEIRETRDIEQLHFILGFNGMHQTHPDFYAGSIFSMLFGGGMSSRLFQEIRERRGLVYSVYCFASSYSDNGLFAIYAGTGPDEAAELVPVLCDEIAKVRSSVSTGEVERAKRQLKASLLMGLESSAGRCEHRVRQLMAYDKIIPVNELVEKVDAVTCQDVCRVANHIFSTKPSLSLVGPSDKVPGLDYFTKKLA